MSWFHAVPHFSCLVLLWSSLVLLESCLGTCRPFIHWIMERKYCIASDLAKGD
uniref:Uncharacterized protein n=1 Tax=Manihot esculenta TaxID=3983 RepID=A0A2C9WEL0_MANES